MRKTHTQAQAFQARLGRAASGCALLDVQGAAELLAEEAGADLAA
jgi:hypothetical protein